MGDLVKRKHGVRRYEKLIDKLILLGLKDMGVVSDGKSIRKFAHDENDPQMELKYDFIFDESTPKDALVKVVEAISARMASVGISDWEMIDQGDNVFSAYVFWDREDRGGYMKEQDIVKKAKEIGILNEESTCDIQEYKGGWYWGLLGEM